MITLLVISVGGFTRVILSASRATSTQHEWTVAQEAARGVIETLHAADFADVFARYNDDASDDPASGASPGAGFAVASLSPMAGDADGLAGEIVFPTTHVLGALELREDAFVPRLEMPRDLNGDGVVDDEDHAGDYRILPVLVRVEWRSPAGKARLEMATLLADYR